MGEQATLKISHGKSMKLTEATGRAMGTAVVVVISLILLGLYYYPQIVEFNEFDPLQTFALVAQFFGIPILFLIALGAACEASVAACFRGKGQRAPAGWSAMILWIVAVAMAFYTRIIWAS